MINSKLIKYLTLIATLTIVLQSCNKSGQQAKIEELKKENRALKRERANTEENLYRLSETINFIQSNLDTIKEQEQIISTLANNDIEQQPETKEQISQDITSIYNKLISNRRKLSRLQASLNRNANINKDLKAIINRLNMQMDEKIAEVETLRNRIENMQGKITNLEGLVDTLRNLKQQQEKIIAYQQEKMNTVYYAYGTGKELKANGVITKEGGLLGIGRTRKLKDELNKEYFTPVNKYNFDTLYLNARKIRIVTPHPENSYIIHGKRPVESLEIVNPNEFWSNTKYLVIEIK